MKHPALKKSRCSVLFLFFIVTGAILAAGCGGGGGGGDGGSSGGGGGGVNPPSVTSAVVLGANDLGMHCMDREYSVFSILPPFNIVNAQVLALRSNGVPMLMTGDDFAVRYDAVADASGSINTTSIGKTNFWNWANALFGRFLSNGEGLTGFYMPQDNPGSPGPQDMPYDSALGWFEALGIPITPTDDSSAVNPYPLMRLTAYNKTTGSAVGFLDVVVPVSIETDCQTCHKTGGIGAADPGIIWASDPDKEIESKLNILILHDFDQGSNLSGSTPVLCSSCHYSRALDLNGAGPTAQQAGKQNFSQVMHRYHGNLTDGLGNLIFPPAGTVDQTCYQCHPGRVTQCQRGAMKTGGMDCFDCHGNMLAVGGQNVLLAGGSIDSTNDGGVRRPWLDLPRCQSCHTGDAINRLSGGNLVPDPASGGIRLLQAYRTGDPSASPLLAVNKRFAENNNTLYRLSKGHGGVFCEGCHGSTHAVWPNAIAAANDNVAAVQLQGYSGKIIECTACHGAGTLGRTTNGPHGLHNVNDAIWYDDGHESFYENNRNSCKACHGLTLTGTPLAAAAAARSFRIEDRTVTYIRGALVRCDKCHEMPDL